MQKKISLNIAEEDLKEIDFIAGNVERDRSWVINRAIKDFIADAKREAAQIEEDEKGPYRSLEDVLADLKLKMDRSREEKSHRKHKKAS